MFSILKITTILEPSCGTCEIVGFLNKSFNNVVIDGIELNATIFEKIRDIDFNSPNMNQVNLINQDFVVYPTVKKYDLIVVNPPYAKLLENGKRASKNHNLIKIII